MNTAYSMAIPAMTPTTPMTEPTITRVPAPVEGDGAAAPEEVVEGAEVAAAMAAAASDLIEAAAEEGTAVWVKKKASTPSVPETIALCRSDEMLLQPVTVLYLLLMLLSTLAILDVSSAHFDVTSDANDLMTDVAPFIADDTSPWTEVTMSLAGCQSRRLGFALGEGKEPTQHPGGRRWHRRRRRRKGRRR